MAEDQKKESAKETNKFKKIIDEIDKLGALELSELVKALEDHYQVSSAPAPVAAAPANAGGEAAPAEEQKSEFDVVLKDPGAQKVAVIKAVKDVTGLGLGEAKALVDGAPKTLKEKVKKEEAEEIKAKLSEAGATVEFV